MATNKRKVMLPHTMGQQGISLIKAREDIETVIYPAGISQADLLPQLSDCVGIALSGTPYRQTEMDASPAMQVIARIGVELCVAAGLPTFCEKPVARDNDEVCWPAGSLRRGRRSRSATRACSMAFAAARAAVADGDLGMVHTVRLTTLDPAPPPRAYLAASGAGSTATA